MPDEKPVWKDWLSPYATLAYLLATAGLVASLIAYSRADREPPEERRWATGSVNTIDPYTRLVGYNEDADPFSHVRVSIDYKLPNVAVYSVPAVTPSPPSASSGLGTGATDSTLSDGIEKKDPYRVDRILVATVTKGLDALPGDRLVWTRVFVKPINFHFAGFTVAATANKTLKVADIETTENSKIDLDPEATALLPLLKTVGVSRTSETNRKVSAQITEVVEDLGVDIQPEFLRIIRESGTGGDVMGNTRIKLSIVTDPTLIRATPRERHPAQRGENVALFVSSVHLSDGGQHLTDETGAEVTVLPQNVLPHCPLTARVWMLYEYRKIVAGSEHHTEGLQIVELDRSGEDVQDVEIVPADDIAPAVWSINYQQNGQPLTAHVQGDTPHRLVFSDYVTASELIHWLKIEEGPKILGGLQFDFHPDDTLIPTKANVADCGYGAQDKSVVREAHQPD